MDCLFLGEQKINEFHLILVAPDILLCAAFRDHFAKHPNITIVKGVFEDLAEFDCIVSPANSFGLMDGGIDYDIIQYFGNSLKERVQQKIINEYLGEQNIGTSIIVETDNPKHPFIAHTPTMRVPLNIANTDNVYQAMWAMLLAVRKHNMENKENLIKTVACPGLGTGSGRVPYNEAARQMSLAYNNFLNPPTFIEWDFALNRNFQIQYGKGKNL